MRLIRVYSLIYRCALAQSTHFSTRSGPFELGTQKLSSIDFHFYHKKNPPRVSSFKPWKPKEDGESYHLDLSEA